MSRRRAAVAALIAVAVLLFFALDLGRFLDLEYLKQSHSALAALHESRPVTVMASSWIARLAGGAGPRPIPRSLWRSDAVGDGDRRRGGYRQHRRIRGSLVLRHPRFGDALKRMLLAGPLRRWTGWRWIRRTRCRSVRWRATGQPLRKWNPQKRALYLVGTGDRNALGIWGRWSWQGRWAWQWKNRIDRAFVAAHAGQQIYL